MHTCDDSRTIPTLSTGSLDDLRGRLYLLIVANQRVAMHLLPESGTLRIGRSRRCDIPIDDASISREHVTLSFDGSILVSDLGSANGTHLRGNRLPKDTPVEVSPNEPLTIGEVTAVIQRLGPIEKLARADHDAFVHAIAEQCKRTHQDKSVFAVLRVHPAANADDDIVEEALDHVLRTTDIAGRAGAIHEALLVDADEVNARILCTTVCQLMRSIEVPARVGFARFPNDGHQAEALINAADRAARSTTDASDIIVLESSMMRVHEQAQQVAAGTASVLLVGEAGSGRRTIAETIHRASPRRDQPFVTMRCVAVSDTVVESELFGHEAGASAGASHAKAGILETAHGGTVFLDEVGELSLELQTKLLQAVQTGQITRIGGDTPRSIDVRVVAATTRDLQHASDEGAFRRDLLAHLGHTVLSIPPLRERPHEVQALTELFIAEAARIAGRVLPRLAPAAMHVLRTYEWPGNVRQLRSAIERAVLLSTDTVTVEHLALDEPAPEQLVWEGAVEPTHSSTTPLEDITDERQRILRALEDSAGNQTKAAKLLGISRRTLINRLDTYELPRPRKRTK